SLPVHVTPYGFPVEEFTARAAPPTGPFRVLSVGTHDLRKGTPYLLEAWKRAAIPDAMCCATPVVTTPCGGGPECITDGVDGWIVPPRDVDALVHRFRAAAADRDACARVGRAARARAERGTWTEAGRSFLREIGA